MLGIVGLTLPGALLGALLVAFLGALLQAPQASAGSFDCASHWLNRTEATICGNPQLMRMDEQLARRLGSFALRLNFGQYLGLRHWQAVQARQRSQCSTDRDCIVARFRMQDRFLDRLQRCVAGSQARRACLREVLAGDHESSRR
jgi:uncharacterized protein